MVHRQGTIQCSKLREKERKWKRKMNKNSILISLKDVNNASKKWLGPVENSFISQYTHTHKHTDVENQVDRNHSQRSEHKKNYVQRSTIGNIQKKWEHCVQRAKEQKKSGNIFISQILFMLMFIFFNENGKWYWQAAFPRNSLCLPFEFPVDVNFWCARFTGNGSTHAQLFCYNAI